MNKKHKSAKILIGLVLAMGGLCFPLTRIYAISVDIHVPEKYTDVKAGERLYFEVGIKYPENITRKDLRLEYQILKDGNLIAISKVLKAVETQASFMDYIVIPESAKKGMYEISVDVSDYGDLTAQVSASFYVAQKGSELKIYFYIMVAFIVALGIILFWQINKLKKTL